jgi:hypothetical protein
LSDVSSQDVIQHRHGRPANVANHRSNARFQRRCQELMVMVALSDEERLELIAAFRDQGRLLMALYSSQREMDDLKLKSAVLEAKHMVVAALLLEAQ